MLVFPDPGFGLLEALPRRDLLTQLKTARATAAALGAVHDAHIVHGHPNPQTILVHRETGEVTLIGFDHGTRLDESHPESVSPDALAGRLAFLSPEQTGRMNRGVGYRSDFYAFGVTLFELLTGELPLRARDAAGWVHAHIARRPHAASQVEPSVPDAVSAIVARLLEKNAEDRYQSARGLLADLDTCISQLETTGVIDDFDLGSEDVSDRFLLPSKLYGRDPEVERLLTLVDDIHPDGPKVGLVSGWSGIGKSALVGEVHRPLSERHGYFVVGKSEPHTRHVPYFSLLQALADLCNQLLTEPEEQIAT
ncbi:MAG: AAA family ATPase [Proteobacteria bacterium]|nr:AAA family ATPase [Pseudomonadota bacterium]